MPGSELPAPDSATKVSTPGQGPGITALVTHCSVAMVHAIGNVQPTEATREQLTVLAPQPEPLLSGTQSPQVKEPPSPASRPDPKSTLILY